jgi:hypothetical protein
VYVLICSFAKAVSYSGLLLCVTVVLDSDTELFFRKVNTRIIALDYYSSTISYPVFTCLEPVEQLEQPKPNGHSYSKVNSAKLSVSLSPQHGTSLGCRWRRQPPDMQDSCEYFE